MKAAPGEDGLRPTFPPGLIRRTTKRLTNILKNVTIEPAMFLIAFSTSMDDLSLSQMIIHKSCKVDFGLNDTICDNLETDYKDENLMVQEEV
jgi:hypothetical protein